MLDLRLTKKVVTSFIDMFCFNSLSNINLIHHLYFKSCDDIVCMSSHALTHMILYGLSICCSKYYVHQNISLEFQEQNLFRKTAGLLINLKKVP